MAPAKTTTTVAKVATPSSSPYQLDSAQTLRATKALVRKIQSDAATQSSSSDKKESLLADADDAADSSDAVPIWLILTTKKHVVDKKRLKPGKIALPHPYLSLSSQTPDNPLRICLITADPQRRYKNLLAEPSFPAPLGASISRVLGLEKLKAKYHSFEAKRQLLAEHDVFLADDRVITYLPALLGKTFYKSGAKRPIPVSLEGRRQAVDDAGNKRAKLSEGGSKVTKSDVSPADLAAEITKALGSALVHLAPSTTTAVKVGTAAQAPEHLQANVKAVVAGLVERFVPQQWRNVRAVHVKGPDTAALPVWLTEELWAEETQVLEDVAAEGEGRKRKRGALAGVGEEDGVIEVPGADGKMRRLEKPGKKVVDGAVEEAKAVEKAEKAARKEALKAAKVAAKADGAAADKKVKKPRMKAADLN